jgi:hypothetical protein
VPSRPAMTEPANGASGTASSKCGLSCPAIVTLLLSYNFFKLPVNEELCRENNR